MAYSTIPKPSVHFNTVLYAGNETARNISVGFQPDFTWIKGRTGTFNHTLFDIVRGSLKELYSNSTGVEYGAPATLTGWNSDGFILGTGQGTNQNSHNFASWNWKAGTGQGSSNTDGSINTTYTSVNQTAGFSIVSWTNSGSGVATVGHGLGVAPKMIIIKSRNETSGWLTYHESIGNTKGLFLNTTGAEDDNVELFNDTSPTSTVFTTGITGLLTGGSNLIAYCFAEKTGYSKFGKYIGNGNADGSFVYTGFKPAFVMSKMTSSADNWVIQDNKRLTYNTTGYTLNPNANNVENTNYPLDILSNGFKQRTANATTNQSGQTFIYMAFAEEPLVANSGTDGVPATAR